MKEVIVSPKAVETLNDHIGSLSFKIIQNVSFTFSNANSATKSISDIDSSLATAKFIYAFAPSTGFNVVGVARNGAATSVTLYSDISFNGTYSFNLFVVN